MELLVVVLMEECFENHLVPQIQTAFTPTTAKYYRYQYQNKATLFINNITLLTD